MAVTPETAAAREVAPQLARLAPFTELVSEVDPVWLDTLRYAQDIEIPAGTVLLCRGQRCEGFLLPYSGTIRVQQASSSGREVVLYRVEPGDICILALTSLLDGVSYSADAVSESVVRGLNIPIDRFEQAVSGPPVFRRYVLTTMAKRLRTLSLLVEEVMFRRLDNRLACLLYQLFDKRDTASLNVTHQELATELGSTREVVSRLLKDIEQNTGSIALHRGRIDLISRDALGVFARDETV